jgi:hypothetical protein
MDWEDIFKSWGSPPGETEKQKMENAESAIRKAIKANEKLANMDISIVLQGSYNANTNVRQDSDVDICVCLNSTFFPRYPAGKSKEYYGNTDGTIHFKDFKNLVHIALGDYFDYNNVTPGNKAFDIHSNSYRVDADVLPAFAYRYYLNDGTDRYIEPTGIAFNSDDGKHVINWPFQAYKNGVDKQKATNQRYKKMVRVIKRLRNEMQDEKIEAAKDIGSFQIESTIWNVPDNYFNHEAYQEDVKNVLAYCFNETLPLGNHAKMMEVNGRKLLFENDRPWTREQAHNFFSAAWEYISFE